MKLWIFNNYNMLPQHGPMNRHYYMAKHLQTMGHEPVVFVGSHPHNSNVQLIEGKESYCVFQREPVAWVLVKTCRYQKNKVKQVFSMFQYCLNAAKAAKSFEKPDVILGSSAHPLAAWLAIHLGRKYGCKTIVEVRDLWPESIVAYGVAGAHNPLVLLLRRLEKWLYVHADAVVFTMEGAYDYIVERGWEKDVPRSKVHYINNGVDLEQFDDDREHYRMDDPDLDDSDTFKVVYTGSIRRVNNLGLLLDTAKLVSDPRVKFLIWGDGDERDVLEQRVKDENIPNVVFKGRVEKKYIPGIVSRADVNIAHNTPSPLFRFGICFNKLFDYLAAGKPVLSDFPCSYDPTVQCGAGISVEEPTAKNVAVEIEGLAHLGQEQYRHMGTNARKAAEEKYDFRVLTKQLLYVMEGEA